MIREARACIGCSAEAIDALVVAYRVTDSVVVDVPDVTATATSDAAQVWTGLGNMNFLVKRDVMVDKICVFNY